MIEMECMATKYIILYNTWQARIQENQIECISGAQLSGDKISSITMLLRMTDMAEGIL